MAGAGQRPDGLVRIVCHQRGGRLRRREAGHRLLEHAHLYDPYAQRSDHGEGDDQKGQTRCEPPRMAPARQVLGALDTLRGDVEDPGEHDGGGEEKRDADHQDAEVHLTEAEGREDDLGKLEQDEGGRRVRDGEADDVPAPKLGDEAVEAGRLILGVAHVIP